MARGEGASVLTDGVDTERERIRAVGVSQLIAYADWKRKEKAKYAFQLLRLRKKKKNKDRRMVRYCTIQKVRRAPRLGRRTPS